MTNLINYLLHLDKHLSFIIENYGLWCYLIFFLVITSKFYGKALNVKPNNE